MAEPRWRWVLAAGRDHHVQVGQQRLKLSLLPLSGISHDDQRAREPADRVRLAASSWSPVVQHGLGTAAPGSPLCGSQRSRTRQMSRNLSSADRLSRPLGVGDRRHLHEADRRGRARRAACVLPMVLSHRKWGTERMTTACSDSSPENGVRALCPPTPARVNRVRDYAQPPHQGKQHVAQLQ